MNNYKIDSLKNKYIHGILSIIIILHHLYERYLMHLGYRGTHYKYLVLLYDCSYIFIPWFMFLSGYSLYSNLKNNNNYLKGFCKRRILPIYIQLVIIVITLSILSQFTSTKESISDIVKDITLIKTFDNNGWYVIAIIIFYIVFYISFKSYKNNKLSILSIIVCTLIYIGIGLITNHGQYILQGEIWYNSVHLFVIGIIYSYNENNQRNLVLNHYKLKLFICTALLLLIIPLVIYVEETQGYYGEFLHVDNIIERRIKTLIVQQVAGILSTSIMVLIIIKANVKEGIITWLGDRALEIYLVHYGLISMCKSEYFDLIDKVNYFILSICIIVITIPLSHLLNKIRKFTYNKLHQ